MAQAQSASAFDYRASQQSHHQKILSQLLAHQQVPAAADPTTMFIDSGNSLGLSAPGDIYSSTSSPIPSASAFQSSSGANRASASSSVSSGSSDPYLKSPHIDAFNQTQSNPVYAPNWDSVGWGEMTFGMVAQAQANLAMNMNNANSFAGDKHLPNAHWLPTQSQNGIDPGYLHQQPSTISIDQYPQPPMMFASVPPSATLPQPFAASPLRSVSPGSVEEDSGSDDESDETESPDLSGSGSNSNLAEATRRSSRLRKRSDSDFILESPGSTKRNTARRLTWTSTNDARQREFEVEINKRELERIREMKKFEESNGKGNRKERRRLQNRLAQRAFRARSKIQGKEFNEHMGDLQSLTVDQSDRIKQLTQIVDRLQKENAALKAGRWAAFQGIQPGSVVGDGNELTGKVNA